MKSVIRIDVPGPLAWKAFQSPSSKRWLAVCDALKSTREGDSLDELYREVEEETQRCLLNLLRCNKLQDYLHDRGWRASDIDEALGSAEVEFDVSWVLIAPKQSASSAA